MQRPNEDPNATLIPPDDKPDQADSLRSARFDDLIELSDLVNSAYRGESSRAGWTTEADLLDGQRTDPALLAKMIGPDHEQTILVYFRNSALVGSVYLKRNGTCGYLGMLTVSPQLQAGGMGRKILESAENWALKSWGSQKIEMTVIDSRTELIAWYERRGYKKTARREPFPIGDKRFGVPRVAHLEFIVLEKSLTEPR